MSARRHRLPTTGSRVHRLWCCPPSAVLPAIVDDAKEAKSEPARGLGKEIHRFLELVGPQGREAALAAVTISRDAARELAAQLLGDDPPSAAIDDVIERNVDLLAMLAAIDITDLPVNCSSEVAFRYNWRTGDVRLLGQNLNRDYASVAGEATWEEIDATIDIAGVQGDKGLISDYKSGHVKYPAPDKFGQTLLAGLCLLKHYNLSSVVLELITIHDDGGYHSARRTVDEWDLGAWELELRAAFELVEHWDREYLEGRKLGYHEGAHCTYCPAFKNCDAKRALIQSVPTGLVELGLVEGEGGALVLSSPNPLTVRNAAEAWMAIERWEGGLRAVKEAICSMGWVEPIPLPDGRVIEPFTTERRALDGSIGAAVLERRYGREEAMKRVTLKMALSDVRQAVAANLGPKEKIEKRDGTGALDIVLKEIEQLGGIAFNSKQECKPHIPKRKR